MAFVSLPDWYREYSMNNALMIGVAGTCRDCEGFIYKQDIAEWKINVVNGKRADTPPPRKVIARGMVHCAASMHLKHVACGMIETSFDRQLKISNNTQHANLNYREVKLHVGRSPS
jgi:hypothetical protein